MSLYNPQLQELTLGGSPLLYNQIFSYKGLSLMQDSQIRLKKVTLKYCTKIGTKSLEILANSFYKSLEEVVIIRNCLDQSTPLNDESLMMLSKCRKLSRITINYCR
jgi:hypothetical protein